MRRAFCGFLLAVVVSSSVGCVLPAYSGSPERRARQLLYTSENLRLFLDEWERFWFLDAPDHMTPFRTHGGII